MVDEIDMETGVVNRSMVLTAPLQFVVLETTYGEKVLVRRRDE